MKILTIDTSTTTSSVALTCGERLLAESISNQERTHASRLIGMVEQVLSEGALSLSEIDGFGVAIGPGSFTGLRVGIATVKGLAVATGRPVCGFSSLAMLAMNIPWASHPVCAMFDARKKEVYAALYDCSGSPAPLIEPCVESPSSFLERVSGPTIFVGEGAAVYRGLIVERMGGMALFAPASLNLPRASSGAVLAGEAFARGEGVSAAKLLPCYIRPSEAELAKKARTAQ